MNTRQGRSIVSVTVFLLLAFIAASNAAQAKAKLSETFVLKNPQFLRAEAADSQYIIVMGIDAMEPTSFQKPGMKMAALILTKELATPPKDLKYIDGTFSISFGGDDVGMRWRVRSVESQVDGTAISITGAAAYENIGGRGAIKVSLSDIDKDQQLGIMIYNEDFEPLSNVVLFNASTFKTGDGKLAFKTHVAELRKLQDADTPTRPDAGEKKPSLSLELFSLPMPAQARTWTERTGRKLDAEFIGFADGKVRIKRSSDQKTFDVPIERLSDADKAFVRSQATAKPESSRDAEPSASARPGTAKQRFIPEAISADEAERMQRLGTTRFAVSVFNRHTSKIEVIAKETMEKLATFGGRLDFTNESDRGKFVTEVVRLLGEKRARWGVTISDSDGRPAFRWPGRTEEGSILTLARGQTNKSPAVEWAQRMQITTNPQQKFSRRLAANKDNAVVTDAIRAWVGAINGKKDASEDDVKFFNAMLFFFPFDPIWKDEVFQPAQSAQCVRRITRLPDALITAWRDTLGKATGEPITKTSTVVYLVQCHRLFQGDEVVRGESDRLLARIRKTPKQAIESAMAALECKEDQAMLELIGNDWLYDQDNVFRERAFREGLQALPTIKK